MLKNITLSADEELIRKARERAEREHRSLNDAFREWLGRYGDREDVVAKYQRLMERLSYVRVGKKFTREELNERR